MKIDLNTPLKDFLFGMKNEKLISKLGDVPTVYDLCFLSWQAVKIRTGVQIGTIEKLENYLAKFDLRLGMTEEELDAYSGAEYVYTLKSSDGKQGTMATILSALIIARGSSFMNEKIMSELLTTAERLTNKLIEKCNG